VADKQYLTISVLDAAKDRLAYVFSEFEQVMVGFSGGKDSGVVLNLTLDYAREHGALERVIVYHLDYEAQYQMTTDYVTEVFAALPKGIRAYWLCLPTHVTCSTSMHQTFWVPWNPDEEDIWVRPLPESPYLMTADAAPFDWDGWDYDVQDRFCEWVAGGVSTCVLLGIRAQESLNRHSSITSGRKVNQHKGRHWLNARGNYVLGYPIYDWETEDIWTANARFGYTYNHLYDLMYQAGMSIHQMRVASPFLDYGKGSLSMYRVIDPANWGRLLGRVNGVNFTGIYGNTTAMGWRSITKPPHFTWKEYMYFLLDTLPEETRRRYLKKLAVSQKFWREKGGALDAFTVAELKAEEAPATYTGEANNYSLDDKEVVRFQEYLDDTQVTNFKLIPSYKRMCVCIIKNDYTCKYMGFAQTKKEAQRREDAVDRYRELL
jgi:predicted phosphoadenosine phosphosulfate sulfurtransferase